MLTPQQDDPRSQAVQVQAQKVLAWTLRSPWRIALVLIGAPVLIFAMEWIKFRLRRPTMLWPGSTGYELLAIKAVVILVAVIVVVVRTRRPRQPGNAVPRSAGREPR
jgi:hypothetical protein